MPAFPDPTVHPSDDHPQPLTQWDLLTSLVARAPVGIGVFDDRHRCLQLNEALASLLGLPTLSLRGRTVTELLPTLAPDLVSLFERAQHEPVATADLGIPDGPLTRWWQVTVYPVPLIDGADGFALVALDISARKQAQADLVHREAALSSAFAVLDGGFGIIEVLTDGDGQPVDGQLVLANQMLRALLGPLGGSDWSALGPAPGPDRRWLDTWARVALGGETVRFEGALGPPGSWSELFAAPLGERRLAVIHKDLTERHRWERRLRDSEERFRTLADELPILIWENNSTGAQEWVNRTFCTFFGVDRDRMRGDEWQHLVHPADLEPYRRAFEEAVQSRSDFHSEVRCRRADGRWRWLESRARPRLGPRGEFLGHLGTSIDISERREAEAALRASAALNAYRATLADTLRLAADVDSVQHDVSDLLARHLGAALVRYVELAPPTGSGSGRERLNGYGPAILEEVREGRVVVVHDVTRDDRIDPTQMLASVALDIGAFVVAPVGGAQGAGSAVLLVHHQSPHTWSSDEVAAITDTADRMAVAIDRARAETALRERHRRAELVATLLADLEREPTVSAQLQCLVDALVPTLADFATVEAPGEESSLLAVAHRDPEQIEVLRAFRLTQRGGGDAAYSSERAAGGEAQLLNVPTPDAWAEYLVDDESAAVAEQLGPFSSMAVPLELGAGIRGALLVSRSDPDRAPFTRDDLDFLRESSQRVGVVLAAGRLRHLQHDISLRLQRALLPDTIQWHPNLEIEARYWAASDFLEVGGDWYDTFAWPDGRIGVIVGDVVGHNLDSAAAMGRLRAATSALAGRLDPSPAALLSALDDYARGPDGTNFVTVVCVVVDPATGMLTYSSAGHPPPLVVTPDGRSLRLEQAKAPPLCSLHRGPWPEASYRLDPGTLVVLYSDGLVERRSEPIEAGISRLEHLTRELAQEPVGGIADQVTEAMSRESSPEDDVVIACLRYTPVLTRLQLQVPARTGELGRLRQDLRRWLASRSIVGVERDDIVLSIGEACTNVVEHAYHDRSPGMIKLDVSDHGHHVTIEVIDHGRWRPPGAHTRLRGRGTHIMRALSTRFARTSGAGGTRVELNVPVRPRREADSPAGSLPG